MSALKQQAHTRNDKISLPDIPALNHLKARPQWVGWRYENRGGPKPTKPPIDPHTGKHASANDPSTWGTYEQAVERARREGLPGVGFVLSEDDNITGYDFDNVRNPRTGHIKPWVREIIGETYAEISPSGTGIRLFALGKIAAALANKPARIELYSHGRYLTVTGQHLEGSPDRTNAAPHTKAACRQRAKLHDEIWAAIKRAGPKLFKKNPRVSNLFEERKRETGDTFWDLVNSTALQNLSAWVLSLFPTAKTSNLGYRVSSFDLGRDLEEDISITRQGIKDFGVHDMADVNGGRRSPISLVMEWGAKNTAADAALWLCERMGRDPPSMGWREKRTKEEGQEAPREGDGLVIVTASDVEMSGINWMWRNRFARGKIGLVAGMPDMGKGQIMAFIAAACTANVELPCNEGYAPQGNVLWFNAEDGTRDTILPRLVAAGADTTRVKIVQATRVAGKDRSFSLATDLAFLKKAVEQIGNVVLIIIDSMSAYFGVGKVDGRSATDVRAVLTPLKDMAEELDLAVIGLAHFNKKDDVKSAILRVCDSIAHVAAARHVYAVPDDPEDKNTRLLVKAKNNLAPKQEGALRYGISVKTVGHDEALAEDIIAPYVVWHPHTVDITANEAMDAATGQTAKREAREWLLERLGAGPVSQEEIQEEASQESIAKRTLRRAKKDLGIKSKKERGKLDGGWFWELPPIERKWPPS